jgi:hypothetical protein
MKAPMIPTNIPASSRVLGTFPNLKTYIRMKKTLLALVYRAFTGPRGPTEEAFTIETPPRVFRILLTVPITKKCAEISFNPLK